MKSIGNKLTARYRGLTAMWVGVWLFSSAPAFAVEVHGFLEPFRTVDVATAETGIVRNLSFRVGDKVSAGAVIATLDDDIHQLLVASAEAKMEAKGRLESAKAEMKLRRYRLEKLIQLIENGHGRREEVERATADMEIAKAQVLDAEDDLLFRTLEHRRLQVELERRQIRSPIDGYVAENLKEVGEFVAPNDPELMTVVQLNPLLARFAMRRSQAQFLNVGQEVRLSVPHYSAELTGIVEEISPVIDAESGTVRIRVRLDNPHDEFDSGQRCLLHLPEIDFGSDNDPFSRETAANY